METAKTEITKLPEGMSSEELDALTTGEESEQDTNLAQEALDATGEPSPAEESAETGETEAEEETPAAEKPAEETEVDPKDAVIGEFRRKLRDAELATAKLQGELETRKSLQTTTEVEKSPLQLAMEAEGVTDPDELEKPFSVMQKQMAWEKKRDAAKVVSDRQAQDTNAAVVAFEDLQKGDLSTEKMGQGLDLQSVIKLGQNNLTDGDLLNIKATSTKRGKQAALKETYNLAIQRTLAAGGSDAKLLKNAINAKKAGKTQPKPKTEKPDIDALTTKGEDTDTGGAETETHSQRLTNFVLSPD